MKHRGSPEERMQKCVDSLVNNLQTVRTGRAQQSLLDRIQVDYYGSPTPLKQLATVSVPEARLLTVQPFDRSSLAPIEKAILSSNIGLAPNNDGKVIRIKVPQLTEERRQQLIKQVRAMAEESKVAARSIRRDLNLHIKKDEELSEDEQKRKTDDVQKLTDATMKKIEDIVKKKEAEVLEI